MSDNTNISNSTLSTENPSPNPEPQKTEASGTTTTSSTDSPKKIGRPSKYTPELAYKFCQRLALGEPVLRICQDPAMPSRETIYNWLQSNSTFFDSYTQARAQQADAYAEQVLMEAFDAQDAQIGKLRVDALKWASSKIAPKKYGDRVEVDQRSEQTIRIEFDVSPREPMKVTLEESTLLPIEYSKSDNEEEQSQ